MFSEHRLISFDETPIFYRRFEPATQLKATLIILHGMGEHGGRYRPLAEYLAEMGVCSYVPDLRGFGKSGGRKAYAHSFSDFHEDLSAVCHLAQQMAPKTPLFILGHSFGGLIASSYSALSPKEKIQGLILSSPLCGIAIPVPEWKRWLGLFMAFVMPSYSQSSGVDPALLTHDELILKEYPQDPLIYHRITAGLYRELCRLLAQTDFIASKLTVPTLLLQAGEDSIVSKEASIDFYHKMASADKELKVYEGFYHEILNEVQRQQVFSRIGAWLSRHFYPQTGP